MDVSPNKMSCHQLLSYTRALKCSPSHAFFSSVLSAAGYVRVLVSLLRWYRVYHVRGQSAIVTSIQNERICFDEKTDIFRNGMMKRAVVVSNCATSPVPRLSMIDNLQILVGTSIKSRAESEGQSGSSTLASEGAVALAPAPL